MQTVLSSPLDRLIETTDHFEMIFAACELGTPSCLTLDWLINAFEHHPQEARK